MSPAPPKRPGSPPSPRRSTAPCPAPGPVELESSELQEIAGADELDEPTNPGRAEATVMMQAPPGLQDQPSATLPMDLLGPSAKLVVIKGPARGTELPLGPGETSIGRNGDNTVVIPDISVSRRHVVLTKEVGSYVLRDQGSGNGTLVNGQRIDEHVLANGDVFTLGDTEVQFVEIERVAAPRRAPSRLVVPAVVEPSPEGVSKNRAGDRASPREARRAKLGEGDFSTRFEATGRVAVPTGTRALLRRKKLLAVIAGGVAVIWLAGLWVKHRASVARAEAEAAEQARAQAAADAFNEGVALTAQGKWAEALPRFQRAKEQGSQEARLGDYIGRATKESVSEKLLADAADALGKGELAAAWGAASRVPGDSLLSDRADDLRGQIKSAVTARAAAARVKIAAKDLAGAAALLDDAAKVDPANPDLVAAQGELAKAQDRPPPVHLPSRPVQVADHSGEVVRAFDAGDLKSAKALAAQYGATDDKVRSLAQWIGDFEGAYGRVDDVANLERARALDMRISGGRSAFTPKLNQRAVAVYLREGAQAKSAGNLAKAYRAFKEAFDADNSSLEARNQLMELRQRAKDLYLTGYVKQAEDPEAARKIFLDVLSITPSDDESHQKAQRRLQEMGNN